MPLFPPLQEEFLYARTGAQQELLRDLKRNLLHHRFRPCARDLMVLLQAFGMHVRPGPESSNYFHQIINELMFKVGRGLQGGEPGPELLAFEQQLLADGAAHKTSRSMKVRFNPAHARLLQTLALQMTYELIAAGRLREACNLLEGFTPHEPFASNALIHGYAGLLGARLLARPPDPAELAAVRRRLGRALELAPEQFPFVRALLGVLVLAGEVAEADAQLRAYLGAHPGDVAALDAACEFWTATWPDPAARAEVLAALLCADPTCARFEAVAARALPPAERQAVLLRRIDTATEPALLNWRLLAELAAAGHVDPAAPTVRAMWRREFLSLPDPAAAEAGPKLALLYLLAGPQAALLEHLAAAPHLEPHFRQLGVAWPV